MLIIIAVVFIVMAMLGGCESSDFRAEHAAARDFAEILGVDEQKIESKAHAVNDRMSESHRMMAFMILSGAGMDTDFESYDEVFLVDVATSDGSNTGKVVVVEKDGIRSTVIPDSLKNP